MNYSISKSSMSNFMRMSIIGCTAGVKKRAKYKEGAELMAADAGGDASAFDGGRKLFEGHSAELDAMVSAYNKQGNVFKEMTEPFKMGATRVDADGKSKTRAKGERLITVKYLTGPDSIWAAMKKCEDVLKEKRDHFRDELPRIIQAIANDAKLGRTFNIADYPTQDDIDTSYFWTIEGPFPVEDERMLIGLPLEEDWAKAIEADVMGRLQSQVRFAQQNVAKELLASVQMVANSLSELVKFKDGLSPERKKAPSVSNDITARVLKAIEKGRAYAIPETDDGMALLALMDEIAETLEPERFTPEDFRDSVPLARHTADKATALASAIEAMPIFM